MSDPLNTAKETVTVVTAIMKAAGDNEDVKSAGANLGQTALTITKAINNVLLPIAAINFAFDKARLYFSDKDKFQKDFSEKTSSIPVDQIIDPKPSIAGPALQGLAFTHEEPSLKNMYLSLLASAMDRRSTEEAHPAFVEIIKQLDSQEANLLKNILRSEGSIAIAEIRKTTVDEGGFKPVLRHLVDIHNSKTNTPVKEPRAAAMIDNWIRLGLVAVDYTKNLVGENNYAWVELRPEYKELSAEMGNDRVKITFQKGIMDRTALGSQFARAVGLTEK